MATWSPQAPQAPAFISELSEERLQVTTIYRKKAFDVKMTAPGSDHKSYRVFLGDHGKLLIFSNEGGFASLHVPGEPPVDITQYEVSQGNGGSRWNR